MSPLASADVFESHTEGACGGEESSQLTEMSGVPKLCFQSQEDLGRAKECSGEESLLS